VTTDQITSPRRPTRSLDVPRIVAWVTVVALSVVLWAAAIVAVTSLV
jgi:hypothetical protein